MQKGTVAYFDFDRKFGFIVDTDQTKYYFNRTNIRTNAHDIKIGSTVRFDPGTIPPDRDCPVAYNVEVGVHDASFLLAGIEALTKGIPASEVQ